jgi:hypothetical protein
MTGDGFQSDMAAQFVGQQTLANFLLDLAKERETHAQVRRLATASHRRQADLGKHRSRAADNDLSQRVFPTQASQLRDPESSHNGVADMRRNPKASFTR